MRTDGAIADSERTVKGLWGAVLFEMLTGRKLFDAGDVSEMLASVLVKDPDISSIGNDVPAHIRSVVRQCLV